MFENRVPIKGSQTPLADESSHRESNVRVENMVKWFFVRMIPCVLALDSESGGKATWLPLVQFQSSWLFPLIGCLLPVPQTS